MTPKLVGGLVLTFFEERECKPVPVSEIRTFVLKYLKKNGCNPFPNQVWTYIGLFLHNHPEYFRYEEEFEGQAVSDRVVRCLI